MLKSIGTINKTLTSDISNFEELLSILNCYTNYDLLKKYIHDNEELCTLIFNHCSKTITDTRIKNTQNKNVELDTWESKNFVECNLEIVNIVGAILVMIQSQRNSATVLSKLSKEEIKRIFSFNSSKFSNLLLELTNSQATENLKYHIIKLAIEQWFMNCTFTDEEQKDVEIKLLNRKLKKLQNDYYALMNTKIFSIANESFDNYEKQTRNIKSNKELIGIVKEANLSSGNTNEASSAEMTIDILNVKDFNMNDVMNSEVHLYFISNEEFKTPRCRRTIDYKQNYEDDYMQTINRYAKVIEYNSVHDEPFENIKKLDVFELYEPSGEIITDNKGNIAFIALEKEIDGLIKCMPWTEYKELHNIKIKKVKSWFKMRDIIRKSL